MVKIDAENAEAIIEASSELAWTFGEANTPICQPICNVLETIGSRSLKKSVIVIEKSGKS